MEHAACSQCAESTTASWYASFATIVHIYTSGRDNLNRLCREYPPFWWLLCTRPCLLQQRTYVLHSTSHTLHRGEVALRIESQYKPAMDKWHAWQTRCCRNVCWQRNNRRAQGRKCHASGVGEQDQLWSPDCRRFGQSAPSRNYSPRSETRQRHADQIRREAAGFRSGQAAGGALARCGRTDRDDSRGRAPYRKRHALIHSGS